MKQSIGSTWHKWDFHVHTPYSILNNGYGFDPFNIDDEDIENLFDQYVQTLFTKAVDQNIMAIGITDYFMIDGYKRILENYIENPTKMSALFPDEAMRNKIKQIYIFPNIEFRLDKFVGEGAKSVNYHVIFSDKVPIQEIEDNFLHQIQFQTGVGALKPISKSNIKNYGEQIKRDNHESGSDLLVGLKHITVDYNDILRTLSTIPAFSGKYLITIPVDEDLSNISWNGRYYSIRRDLYQQCDCYMTSNRKTIEWALAKGEEEDRKREFRSLKPCIWGSDAHEYDRMFQPENSRFCWIKAELSFEGLCQILYEPAERVAIQENCPNEKDSHQIIASIQFEDTNFQVEPIVFNDDLTCIIGGKSTGKSLLLQQLANSIDPSYAKEQERISSPKRKIFSVRKTEVLWKDGTSERRKIVYIPQTYLNRTIDDPEQSTAVTNIIENVLQQEPDIAEAFSELENTLKAIRNQVRTDVFDYCEKVKELQTLENTIKEEGTPVTFQTVIDQLEKERSELANRVNLTSDEINRYTEIEIQLGDLEKRADNYKKELSELENLPKPILVIPTYFSESHENKIIHLFQDNFPHSSNYLQKAIKDLSEEIQPQWKEICDELVFELNELLADVNKDIEQLRKEYENLRIKIEQNGKLQQLSMRISEEREKLQLAEQREESKTNLMEKILYAQTEVVQSQDKFLNAYKKYCTVVAQTGTRKDTTLTFDAIPVWKQRNFQNELGNIFDNRNYSSFKSQHGYDLLSLSPDDYGEKLLNKLWNAMSHPQSSGALTIKSAYNMESALLQIFGDWYNIHYIVKSGVDTIEEMSPGKKALVLLELLINLETSKCPILIDQPEDDLDNRSIYEDLVQYIREKKRERQIIIVTHNANIVLGADAEEIIIANQDGIGTENASKRFEYRSGAIENDEIGKDDQGVSLPGILNKQGIQTQICDILEGGRLAFELRQNKYKRHPQ